MCVCVYLYTYVNACMRMLMMMALSLTGLSSSTAHGPGNWAPDAMVTGPEGWKLERISVKRPPLWS
jgi:hypothetical protein